jgi:RNA-directed DNA polymerase
VANALETSLMRSNLEVAWRFQRRQLIRSCFGVDRQTGREFRERFDYEVYRLRERALGAFKPSGLLAIAKPKPTGGNRILCVPTIADRLLQFAVLAELRPRLGKRGLLNGISYGLVRGANKGVREARIRALQLRHKYPWVYKADIQKFFDNIPRAPMKEMARRMIDQRSLRNVVLSFVDTEITDGFDPNWKEIIARAGIVSGKGVRQGMPLSPYFAGMALCSLDKALESRGVMAVRYVDDIAAFFESRNQCQDFHDFLCGQLKKLELNVGDIAAKGSKTTIYEPNASADFLGMEIAPTDDGSYGLRVGEACIEKIGSKFCHAGNIEQLLKKRVTLTRLGSYLDSMEAGYLQAYEGAENHNKLVAEVRQMKLAALNAALEELFGERVSTLTRMERRFIGLA